MKVASNSLKTDLGMIIDMLDNTKIRKELGWAPKINLESGLEKTIEWYKNNRSWWKPLKEKLTRENKGFWS